MNVQGFLRAVRRWRWMVILVTLAAAATSFLGSLQLPKSYVSTAIGLVSPKQLIPPGQGVASSDPNQIPSIDQLVETYVGLINTDPVRQRLRKDGIPRDPGALKTAIYAARQPNTTLIGVTVVDEDPAISLAIARDIIPAFNASLDELQHKVGAPDASRLESLVPWEIPAAAPPAPVAPDIPKNVLLASIAALLLTIGLAYVLERLDNTLKQDDDVALRLGVPFLGSTILREPAPGDPIQVELLTAQHINEPLAEGYRALRTNVMYAQAARAMQTLMVTSTRPGEGKTTTACNLAITMAQAGKRVVLVDADFRRPDIHRVFQRKNVGLGNLIIGDRPADELVVTSGVPNLHLVCSGQTPPNPSELLGSMGMRRVVEDLKKRFDLVIFDSPPVAAVTDAAVLGTEVDGTILVVERGATNLTSVQKSIHTLQAVGVDLLGVVLNKTPLEDHPGYYYNYGDQSGADTRDATQQARRSLTAPFSRRRAAKERVVRARGGSE